MIKCLECGEVCKSYGSLSKHVSNHHQLTSRQYYDKHHKVGVCKVCGNSTRFHNINVGYVDTCSRKCAAIMHRRNLKNDPQKFAEFRAKVSNNMTELHANMTPAQKQQRVSNLIETIREQIALMSVEERKVKFGWMNKLTQEEKIQAVQRMIETGCHKWWRDAPLSQKQDVWEKRTDTLQRTWNTSGSEIMAKQMKTFLANCDSDVVYNITLSDQATTILNEIFNL